MKTRILTKINNLKTRGGVFEKVNFQIFIVIQLNEVLNKTSHLIAVLGIITFLIQTVLHMDMAAHSFQFSFFK